MRDPRPRFITLASTMFGKTVTAAVMALVLRLSGVASAENAMRVSGEDFNVYYFEDIVADDAGARQLAGEVDDNETEDNSTDDSDSTTMRRKFLSPSDAAATLRAGAWLAACCAVVAPHLQA